MKRQPTLGYNLTSQKSASVDVFIDDQPSAPAHYRPPRASWLLRRQPSPAGHQNIRSSRQDLLPPPTRKTWRRVVRSWSVGNPCATLRGSVSSVATWPGKDTNAPDIQPAKRRTSRESLATFCITLAMVYYRLYQLINRPWDNTKGGSLATFCIISYGIL